MGDPTATETIIVDDEPFQATTNLAAFLMTLSRGRVKWGWSLDSALHFWVDAICINQANIPERSEQVLHMGEIYVPDGYTCPYLPGSSLNIH